MQLIMGNCIDTLLLSPSLNNQENDLSNDQKLIRCDEEEMQYYVIQQVIQQCHSPRCLSNDKNDNCKSQRIKIVLSKQQLEVLVNNVKELQCGQIPIDQSLRVREGCKRWKPCLATIPEL